MIRRIVFSLILVVVVAIPPKWAHAAAFDAANTSMDKINASLAVVVTDEIKPVPGLSPPPEPIQFSATKRITPLGTAFCIKSTGGVSDFLTANHVVSSVGKIYLVLASDPHRLIDAKQIDGAGGNGVDGETLADAAMIEADGIDCAPVTLAPVNPPPSANLAIAGYPVKRVAAWRACAPHPDVGHCADQPTPWDVKAESSGGWVPNFYIDAMVVADHGNSGGPLFDLSDGSVYGIVDKVAELPESIPGTRSTKSVTIENLWEGTPETPGWLKKYQPLNLSAVAVTKIKHGYGAPVVLDHDCKAGTDLLSVASGDWLYNRKAFRGVYDSAANEPATAGPLLPKFGPVLQLGPRLLLLGIGTTYSLHETVSASRVDSALKRIQTGQAHDAATYAQKYARQLHALDAEDTKLFQALDLWSQGRVNALSPIDGNHERQEESQLKQAANDLASLGSCALSTAYSP